MRALLPLAAVTSILAWGAACQPLTTPVGATLADGQVLVGEVTTPVLVLDGAMGELDIPLQDVGMVLPVEAQTLGGANGHVTVWLRNGSELRGEWVDPELAMGIEVGGRLVDVTLPAQDLQALQLRGEATWPSGDLFRVHTTHGDDFLVDAEHSELVLTNELGTFAPLLAECVSAAPVGDPGGAWRIELEGGTVLIGELADDELTFALPQGPGEVTVPLASLVSLTQGSWGPGDDDGTRGLLAEELDAASWGSGAQKSAPRAQPALPASSGWFRNESLEAAKR